MKISLIGMSGSGKSYWSKQLVKSGFKRICCDDLIEEKLSKDLKKLGFSGIADVSRWMGQPYESRSLHASKQYLELENLVIDEICSKLDREKKVVIDTTGSVIYINALTLKKLTTLTKTIYLQVPSSAKKEMYDLYMKDLKPVIWGTSFNRKSGESGPGALKRCYPDLLEYRSNIYEKLAHITMDYSKLRSRNFSVEKFIEIINR